MFETKCQPIIIDNKKYVLDKKDGELKEILQDFSASGRENPFAYNKRMTNYLSEVYDNFDLPDSDILLSNGRKVSVYKKVPFKLSHCSSYFEFIHLRSTQEKHLSYNESCHCSLCPSCNFFRARNNLKNMITVFEEFFKLPSNCEYPVLFLTLTVPNCQGSELRATIKLLNSAFHKFLGYKEIEGAFIACSRSLEVTVNNDVDSSAYNTFHPHFHVLLVADKDYFSKYKDLYLDKLHLLYLWNRALGVHNLRNFDNFKSWFGSLWVGGKPFSGLLLPGAPSDLVTTLDIKRAKIKGKTPDSCALMCIKLLGEVVKYNFKPDNILTGDISVDTPRVYWLDGALYHVRRWNVSGLFRDILHSLRDRGEIIEETEDGDIVQIAGVDIEDIEAISAWWYSGEFGEYIKGKCKTIEQKNKARRALGLAPLNEDVFKNIKIL